ncbi:DUF4405 domain-containing protein [Bacteroides stercoris]|jgi:hypothetical protein|uniref:DUF4405 domain-containing protein n=2 Tax=Bacteroides stercoris TaxID=46506 RepID=A0A412DAV7_BACSE|nr:DUF4405 domain-containing protein [Bacteroides stercoris]RGZ88060.1 DUF4405 domain-containing protein [Bacteroides stercoris]
MMFRKNKMLLNIVIDFVMLTAMALVSISGFILEIVIPSRHAVKFQGATPWSSQLLGFGRHDWGNIHLWAGIVLVILLAIHILLHINVVSAFIKKKCPNHILRVLLYILFLMLLIMTIVPWFYLCC